jgi:hypothetical protein
MKKMLAILALATGLANCKANSPKPFMSIDLSTLVAKASECDGRRVLFPNREIWMDDEHLVVWLMDICGSDDVQKAKSLDELIFIGSDGGTQIQVQPTEISDLLRGAAGAVLVGHFAKVDLVGPKLQVEQTIECANKKPCAVFASPPGSTESDFAMCSTESPREHCDLYKGLPAARLPESGIDLPLANRVSPQNPYKVALPENISTSPISRTAWQVNEDELWYFDLHGNLTALNVSRVPAPVSAQQWTPKDSNCTGEVSASKPRRFLATCVGTHLYTDGEFDAIFGYSRIALFDVTSKQMLTRINAPALTSAALSPNGRRLATVHNGINKIEVRLYRVD